MARLRKHVEDSEAVHVEGVADVTQEGSVAGEGSGVAGDVEDARHAAGGDGLEQAFVAAGAGRIDDDAADAFEIGGSNDVFRRALDHGQPFDPVEFAVFPRQRDGGGPYFHRRDGLRFPRQERRQRADAAVEFEQILPFHQAGGIRKELLRLPRVRLKERRAVVIQSEISQPLRQAVFAFDEHGLFADDDVALVGIDVDDKPAQFRKALFEMIVEPFERLERAALGAGGGDEDQQEFFAVAGAADDDVPQPAAVAFFVVTAEAAVVDHVLDNSVQFVGAVADNGAAVDGNDLVRAAFEKADVAGTSAGAHGEGGFVAVTPFVP